MFKIIILETEQFLSDEYQDDYSFRTEEEAFDFLKKYCEENCFDINYYQILKISNN